MLKNFLIIVLVCGVFAGVAMGQSAQPKPAKEITNAAFKEAKSLNKNVFLVFHASWCSWCKRLHKVMDTPEVHEIFEKNYAVARLDVLERDEKIAELENAGGKELMAKYGGEKSGLPFYVVLDPDGKLLANSNVMPDKSNIGFPGTDEEIKAFKSIFVNTSKNISESDFTLIIDTIKKNLPPPKKQN